jgi:hypothetical protein
VGEDGGLIAGHARVLRLELGELKLDGFDLSLTGPRGPLGQQIL